MREILMPFWEFLFEAFGVFGIGIAMGIVGFVIVIGYLLIAGVLALIKKIFFPSRSAAPQRSFSSSASFSSSSVSSQSSSVAPSTRSVTEETPKSEEPKEKKEPYRSPSFDDFLERAEKGEAYAQCCCGSMYEHGDGIGEDIEEAIRWFKKAADQGHVLSLYRLGMIYLEGRRGVAINFDLAEEYLTLASEAEDDSAQYQLAMLYSKKNELLCKEKGYTTPEERLGDPRYVENKEKHKYWLKKAAANGNLDAEYILY